MATYSTVMIVPAALRDDANLLGAALGHGPESYTVPIPSDGETTHWGSHSWPDESFFAMIVGAQGGTFPPVDWAAHGLTDERVQAVLAAVVISAPGSPIDPDGTPYASPSEHAAAVTAGITASDAR